MRYAFARTRGISRAPVRKLARRVATLAGLLAALCPLKAVAQDRLAIRSDILLYGDNTEFRNAFREGETIFGAALRVAAVFDVNERVSLSMGAFGNQRFGSDRAFEEVRPVIALTVRGSRSSFVFGTLPAPTVNAPAGPDRGGPHRLLPPLQRETLAYTRPYEAGLAWTFAGRAIRHDFWLEWQRLNTPDHRERFDGGLNASLRVTDHLAIPVQMHVVHEGGQLYASGAVADGTAVATGVDLHGTIGGAYLASLELLGLIARHVPDRSRPTLSQDGAAFFGRVSGERSGWRGHAIFWRGRNFIKDEGDLNYLSIRRSGERYAGTRDYAEAGLTRRFTLSPSAMLEASGRVHRVESRYEYSYRVMSVVSTSWSIR